MNKKVAVYARVSTKDQSCERQLTDLREYCKNRNWEIVQEFVEPGISGSYEKIFKRKQLSLCMDFLRKRKAQCLAVWSLDRMSRSLVHMVNTAVELRDLNVDFVAYHENIDTTTSQGRLHFNMIASFAEYNREMIIENILSGLRNAKAKGKQLGRPGIPSDKKQEILSYKGRYSSRKIAGFTGVSPASVKRILAQKYSHNVSSVIEETPMSFVGG